MIVTILLLNITIFKILVLNNIISEIHIVNIIWSFIFATFYVDTYKEKYYNKLNIIIYIISTTITFSTCLLNYNMILITITTFMVNFILLNIIKFFLF